ncbi:hypothetical protein [Vreelandella salicampi]|uniref:RiboL-PSP-HEPN domain-containing protein n=1 Tax=Vreelandella salicampi TaxID=1449798 RepID=A0A7Z0LIT4_9GAMM|nr:hypothetical protein [Halomonas salicampi]NYS59674.1 hypothetical protein [Halomonas salicampi]
MAQQRFKSSISGMRNSSRFDSTVYFQDVEVTDLSPIHRFVKQRELLTTILGAENDSAEWRMKANLVTIGIVSSVETYFRSIIRKCLITDDSSRAHSYRNKVSYGAALFHSPDLLPEALLEESTFLTGSRIVKNINDFTGLQLNIQKEPDLSKALDEYEKVCHLRHCIAHRSGHLGSKNAIELGLETFSEHLEKPIVLTFDAINNVFNICHNLVLECNDYIFESILARTVSRGLWTGDLRTDKKNFKPIFELFSPEPSSNEKLRSTYRIFINHFGIV